MNKTMNKAMIKPIAVLALCVFFVAGVVAETGGEKPFSFTTVDLDGNKVTGDIFSKADITVVNIWGTFCSPCIREMPELGEWAASLPDYVQVIGLVSDTRGETDKATMTKAKNILKKTGADFTNIAYNASVEQSLFSLLYLQYVPTTIFVDKNGRMVGEPVIGANVAAYKRFVQDWLKANPHKD